MQRNEMKCSRSGPQWKLRLKYIFFLHKFLCLMKSFITLMLEGTILALWKTMFAQCPYEKYTNSVAYFKQMWSSKIMLFQCFTCITATQTFVSDGYRGPLWKRHIYTDIFKSMPQYISLKKCYLFVRQLSNVFEYLLIPHGGSVVITAASWEECPGLKTADLLKTRIFLFWSWRVRSTSQWVSTACSSFLPQSKDM